MSLTKIPFIFLVGYGWHVTLSSPNPAPKEVERTILIRDGRPTLELILSTKIPKTAYWVHAAIELMVILAALVPDSTVAESVLTILVPRKDPSRIFLSPMGFLASTLMVMGAFIRIQCYRELGKHFTFQVAVFKNHKLVTSGPYSYVRHPAYTGTYLCSAGIVIWYTAQGSWLRESEVYKIPLVWLFLAPVLAHFISACVLFIRRMPKEDEMLKKSFGKEWDEWARKVPNRLIPGVY